MGTEMIDFSISWDAPIVPSEAIAGIPLGIPISVFDLVLSRYLLKGSTSLYQFEGSPVLKLDRTLDLDGNGGYLFSVYNIDLTNWKEVSDSPHAFGINPSALIVSVDSNFINVIRVFLFERFKNNIKPIHSYQGKLYNKIGLGCLVIDVLECCDVVYDTAEEWFYIDPSKGNLEISGYGVDLAENPMQIIMAFTVVCN